MRNKKKKKYLILITTLFLIIGMLIPFVAKALPRQNENISSFQDKLLRFHVIANSDSPTDQKLKDDITEKILAELKPKLNKSQSQVDTINILEGNLNKIEEIAQKEIAENKKDYNVKAYIDISPFPSRDYGEIKLPSGDYKSLRVVIGEGKGSNWWCVLFPPLCFVDITQGISTDISNDRLKEILSDDEYNKLVNGEGPVEVPVKVKSKIAELFEDVTYRLARNFK